MNSTEIFTQALGLSEPWHVSKVAFIAGKHSNKEFHIWLSFNRGTRFRIGENEYTAYDTMDKVWHHLNFFEHFYFLHDSVPRVKTVEHKTVMVDVPWARKNSGFTLLFEAYSNLITHMIRYRTMLKHFYNRSFCYGKKKILLLLVQFADMPDMPFAVGHTQELYNSIASQPNFSTS